MNLSSSDNIASNDVPQRPATGASGGAPGSGVPGSGVPGAGAGAARGTRTVMWKGKTLNMDTTRSALVRAAQEEQRVAQTVPNDTTSANVNGVATNEVSASGASASGASANAISNDTSPQLLHEHIATLLNGMNEVCGGLQEIYSMVARIADRDSNSERVFNTLHAELSDYKKDFIYEHLKPVIRPLLFLYDSLEQFENETERYDSGTSSTPTSTSTSNPTSSSTSSTSSSTLPTVSMPGIMPNMMPGMMPTRQVRQNTVYFREQLVEALRICEVTPMDTPEGAFNPRFHKAIRTVAVEPALDGQIQHVVRSGWFLNGQLLRPAEVVVGKAVSGER